MIKLLKPLGSYKSGEIINLAKKKELALVKQGMAVFVKIEESCYQFK
jgi:hypothetical protein